MRYKENRRSFAMADPPEDAIGASRLDTRHASLDAVLD
jgi:hypothetical protein